MSETTEKPIVIDKSLYYDKLVEYYNEKPNKRPFNRIALDAVIEEIQLAKKKRERKTRREYHLLDTYNVITVGNDKHLIKKDSSADHIVCYEDLFDLIYDCHVNKTGHGGRGKMGSFFHSKYSIPRPAIEMFISCCTTCKEKRNTSKKIVVRPILCKDFSECGQVDLIDFQSLPDNKYNWILNYQDQSTRFIILRPLVSKHPLEVANQLLQIFSLIGAPKILQSGNGTEFVNQVVEDLKDMWPVCITVKNRLENQGSIESTNQNVENMLRAWMVDTGLKQWSVGLNFVQWQKNCSHHKILRKSPYKTLFGFEPRLLTSSNLNFTRSLDANSEITKKNDSVQQSPNDIQIDLKNELIICCICDTVMIASEQNCQMCANTFHYGCKETSSSDIKYLLCPLCEKMKKIEGERADSCKKMKLEGDKMFLKKK